MKSVQSLIAAICTALLLAPQGYAEQQTASSENVVHDESWHTRFTRKYTAREVAPINLVNTTRLDALLRAGRIYLSLQDAIALALENNLDIELQRYGPQIAQADLVRSQAGGVVRGVPTSISQGPVSATNLQTGGGGQTTTGLDQGLTTSAGGGATILFSGTQIPNLDETMFVNYSWGHRTLLQPNAFTTGVPSTVFTNNQLSAGVQKQFLTGTSVTVGYTQQIQQSNNIRAELNPFTSGNMNLQLVQPLLRGFGIAVNSRNIRIAKNNLKVSDLIFKQQVIATVSAVVNLYSDLVSFNEEVKVKQQALTLNEKLYNDNRKQVEIGTLAPIAIVQAQAEVARSQQELTTAETQVLQQETILKNYLSRTGVSSPALADARVVPTDTLHIPDVEQIRPVQDLVALAVQQRPELEQTQMAIDNSRISLEGSRSQLLPQLDVVAAAQNNGLAGQVNPLRVPVVDGSGNIIASQSSSALVGGFGGVWSQLLARNYPDYSVGFQLTVPLRNRAAQSDVTRDQLSLRQNEIRQRQQVNQIRVEVQTALIGLQQSRAQHQAAQKSRLLQEQNLDAEQKKYALGASTIFFVIQAQRDLAQAQAAEVAALTAYNRSRVAIDRATGEILNTYKVSMDEAVKGQVARPPSPPPEIANK